MRKRRVTKSRGQKTNYRIHNTSIGVTHGGKVIGRFPY